MTDDMWRFALLTSGVEAVGAPAILSAFIVTIFNDRSGQSGLPTFLHGGFEFWLLEFDLLYFLLGRLLTIGDFSAVPGTFLARLLSI